MIIDQKFLDELSAQAKANPRLRQNYDLRTSSEDSPQRMLNALEVGTVLPIHRHTKSTETLVMVRGKLREIFYNDNGEVIKSFLWRQKVKHLCPRFLSDNGIQLRCSKKELSASRLRMGLMCHCIKKMF